MPFDQQNLYDVLQVHATCTFDELRKAYRTRAKLCHPDLFANDPQKTLEFQILVRAFDILSDPDSRNEYDKRLAISDTPPTPRQFRSQSVMDTVADDILEELIVGNDVLKDTSLQTLMLDLARTERFIMFRQAKTLFSQGAFSKCLKLCDTLVSLSPDNILYHFYLAESARNLHKYSKAAKHYRICLQIGVCRNPPQRLSLVRRHYKHMQSKQGWLGKFLAWLIDADTEPTLSEEDKSRLILEEVFAKDEKRQHRIKASGNRTPSRKKLADGKHKHSS